MKKPRKKKPSSLFGSAKSYYKSRKFDEHLDIVVDQLKAWGVPGSQIHRFMRLKTRKQKYIFLCTVIGVTATLSLMPASGASKILRHASKVGDWI